MFLKMAVSHQNRWWVTHLTTFRGHLLYIQSCWPRWKKDHDFDGKMFFMKYYYIKSFYASRSNLLLPAKTQLCKTADHPQIVKEGVTGLHSTQGENLEGFHFKR